ncbi:hypothetical protein [Halomicrobium salinisoli]|uniref:hypothetical protein n=1 Tax=Halomicrobium salinisoli TaxID=2878391 RepID=UPI001CF08109|nr:hypothetical protein [Halomicrobium salinisoli]
MSPDVLDALEQPEYTGENRCLPCTVVNLVIAAAIAVALGRRSRAKGALAFAASAVLIYLRGYLVPGTPTLTKRYLPREVLTWFGKDPEPPAHTGLGSVGERSEPTGRASGSERSERHASSVGERSEPTDGVNEVGTAGPTGNGAAPDRSGDGTATGDDAEHADGEPEGDGASADAEGDAAASDAELDPERFLVEAGLLEPCDDRDDLCLADAFEDRWTDEMDAVAGSVEAPDAAAAFGLEDGEYAIEEFDNGARLLRRDGRRLGQWPSEAALVADVAAARVFEDEGLPGWSDLPARGKGQLLNGLRLFLETCPTGDGAVEFGTETVESCCQSYDVVAATCADTGERLFEQRVDGVEA